MKNETIKKINTFGKVGYIICKIGKIAVIISAIACLIGGIIMSFIPKNAVSIELTTSNTAIIKIDEKFDLTGLLDIDEDDVVVKIGDNTYSIVGSADTPATVTTTVYISNFKWICFACFAVCVAIMFVFHFAEKLCRCFKDCETPFTEEISKQLTKLAWSLIPVSILTSFIGSITESVLMGNFNLTFSIDLITVLLILCVFMLSYIFKHGTILQNESDELL